MDPVTTADLYEASYYLLAGCRLESIQCIPIAGDPICHFSFCSPRMLALQAEYLRAQAQVNLFAFRRAYGQLLSYAAAAKKKWRQQPPAATASEGGAP